MAQEGKYGTDKLTKYPHMFPLDIAIWERYLDSHGDDFLSFDYDVKVGSGTEPIRDIGSEYERMQRILSKYRIDVVGYRSNAIWIIETKPEAGTVAIGQIEAYTRLYKRDMSPKLQVVGCIITDRKLPDMDYLTSARNIKYYIV